MSAPAPQPVGRSREELNAASAALTGFAHEVDCSDAAILATRRAREFDAEAMDAPPAHLVPDEHLLRVVQLCFRTGARAALQGVGYPAPMAIVATGEIWHRVAESPVSRHEILNACGNAVQGLCMCGAPWGHGIDSGCGVG